MIDSKKWIQKWTQKGAAVVVSCSDCCFLFRKRVHEGGCPGASSLVDRMLFETWGVHFLMYFWVPSFSALWQVSVPKGTPKE